MSFTATATWMVRARVCRGSLGCSPAPTGAADVGCPLGEPPNSRGQLWPRPCPRGRRWKAPTSPSPSSCPCWWWPCSLGAFTSTSPSEWPGGPPVTPWGPHGPPCPPRCPLQLPSPHRLQGKPALQLPLAGSHPYDHITVESAFDNPTYETGVSTGPHATPPRAGNPEGSCIASATRGRGCAWGGTGVGWGYALRGPCMG